MSEPSLPERMRAIALDLPEPDDMTNREYWLRTEILEWADKLEALEDRIRRLKDSNASARHKLEFREIDAANEVLQDAYYDLPAARKEQSDGD